jgi:phosphoglycerate kinase
VAALGELRARGATTGVVVAGGAKAVDKLPALAVLARSAEAILLGGALAHVFLARQGGALGASIVDRDALEAAAAVEAAADAAGCELLLPTDVVSTDGLTTDARIAVEVADAVGEGRIALDIGPETAARYAERVRVAANVIWDGPPGAFEMEPFRAGTDALVAAAADCSGTVVVGGGDTTAALRAAGRADAVTYVSTGGAAMLDLLAGRELPALEGLRA